MNCSLSIRGSQIWVTKGSCVEVTPALDNLYIIYLGYNVSVDVNEKGNEGFLRALQLKRPLHPRSLSLSLSLALSLSLSLCLSLSLSLSVRLCVRQQGV